MATTETIFIAVDVETGDSVKGLEKLRADLKGVESEIKSVERARKRGTITAKDANSQLTKLDTTLKKNRKSYNNAQKAAAGFNKEAGGFSKLGKTLTDSYKKVGAAIAGAFAVGKLLEFGGHLLEVTTAFESSAAELSSITGATGDDLDFLKDKAIELSATSTKSSQEVLDAFKLIASAKPELLESGESLALLTEQAIILAEASGLDLAVAAEQLGSVLNAMNLDAGEASNVIDVLANASKLGAREIPFLTTALSKFGGIAAQAGVSVEDSAAAIEVLGKVIPEAATVGTNFRNVLTIMQVEAGKAGREFKGLGGELELLGPDINNVTKLNKIFGRENLLAVQTLIREKDALSELSGQLSITGTAQEQAAINAATLESAFEKLGNVFDNTLIKIGSEGSGGLMDFISDISQGLAEFSGQVDENTEDISVFNTVLESLALSFNVVMLAVKAVVDPFSDWDDAITDVTDSFNDLFNINEESTESTKESTKATNEDAEAKKVAADAAKKIAADKKKLEEDEEKGTTDLIKLKQEEITARKAVSASTIEATAIKNTEIKALQDELKVLRQLGEVSEPRGEEFEDLDKVELLKAGSAAEIGVEVDKRAELKRIAEEGRAEDLLIAEEVEILKEENDLLNEEALEEARVARQEKLLSDSMQSLQAVQDLANVFTTNKLKALDEEYKAELDIINTNEAQKLKDENLTEKQRTEIKDNAAAARLELEQSTDSKSLEIQKKAFKRNKAFNIATATIETAVAVARSLAQFPGPPATIAASVAAGVLGAVQITAIAAQKFEKGGILAGPSHAQGGIGLSVGGNIVAEAEGGEPILTKGVSQNPSLLAAASRINVMGGGKPLMQDGGITPNFDLPTADTGEPSEIIVQSQVSVVEIMEVANNVQVTESKAQF